MLELGRGMKLGTLVVGVLLTALVLSGCTGSAAPTAAATLSSAAESTVAPTVVAASPTTAPAATATATAQLAATATPAAAAVTEAAVELEEVYTGLIEIAGQSIEIEVRFQPADGGLTAELDIPGQGVFGIPVENLTVEGSEISFTILSGASRGVFGGVVAENGEMSGSFVQAGYTGTFTLAPAVAVELPYVQEEVTFSHGDITLAGTLSLPEGDGPFPAVVLISGSGAQDRDENVLGFRVFFELADHLTQNGIAVLRYDDRGVRGSTGDLLLATQQDLAEDVAAAVGFLLGREDIDPAGIGLIGHSEGGYVAPLTANACEGVSYLVLLAGPGTSGEQVLHDQLELIMRSQGATEEEIAVAKEQQAQTLAAVKTGEGWEEVTAQAEAELRAVVEALPEEQRKAIGDIETFIKDSVAEQIAGINNPWFRSFVAYDPTPALLGLKAPVLALFGALDTQVPADANAEAMEAALGQTDVDYRIEVMPEANHLFQKAIIGSPDEYASLEPAFVPGLLELIVDWIAEHAG